jgi:quinolinate synthase
MAIDCKTLEDTKAILRKKLSGIVPDIEIPYKAELVYEINRLKKERNALILGHNYMEPALFIGVPDITGDSLQLSREAAKTDKDPIIFCGVRFMAETAKILNPNKTVLLPAKEAGCSLAEGITAEDVRTLRAKFPGVPIVAYINTYADVKAEVDYCCTSGNAVRLVQAIKSDTIIFLPDEFLAKNVAKETGKNIIIATPGTDPKTVGPDIKMIGWNARCEVHEKFTVEDITNARKQFPDVVVVAHPECSPEVVAASDYTGSTTQLVKYVQESKSKRFLILTECSMGDNIIAENPDKEAIRLCSVRCRHMNQITLEDTLHALKANETLIDVPEEIRVRALKSVERMLAVF